MEKVKKNLGLGTIILSLFFLFNPNINLVDPLPDVIGYAILCRGLVYFADLNEYCGRALELFRRMMAVDAFKLLALFWVFGISSGDEQNTLLLLLSFVFAIAELFFLIPAYNNLFDGILHFGYMHNNNSIMKTKRKRSKRNITEKTKRFTILFVIIKTCMYVLPEFSVLTTQSYNEDFAVGVSTMYDFIGFMRGMAFALTLVFGLIWIVKLVRYFGRIMADRELIDALADEYRANVLPKKTMFLQRHIKAMFFVLMIAAALCIDFRADNFNFLPDVLPAIFFIIFAFMARKYLRNFKKIIIPFSLYAFFAAVSAALESVFFERYYYGAIIRNENAYALYVVMLVFSVLEVVAFLYSIWKIIYVLKYIIDEHTGFCLPEAEGIMRENALARIAKLHRELYRKLYLLGGAACVMATSDILYDFGARKLPFVGMINIICSLIFIGVVYSATSTVFEEVQSKYMLD